MFNNMLIASKYENMKHDSLQQEVAIGTIYAVTPFISLLRRKMLVC